MAGSWPSVVILIVLVGTHAWTAGDPCAAGLEPYAADASACTPCSPGTYKESVGSDACTSCPANSYSGT